MSFRLTQDGRVLYKQNLVGTWDKSDSCYTVTDIRGKSIQCSSINEVIQHFTRFRSWDNYATSCSDYVKRQSRTVYKDRVRKPRFALQ